MRNSWIYQQLKSFVLIYVAKWLTPRKDEKLPAEIFKTEHFLKISYCTTCMGRTFHLKKTYIKNILDNVDYPEIEFVLINYNSRDDMDTWVRENLTEYIDNGMVKYYRTDEPEKFHMSKAKNLSHRLATGDILVNLDADNFLGKNNAYFTNHFYQTNGEKTIIRFSKKDFRFFDTCGRISISRSSFEQLGGYREDLLPYGEEDMDLIRRSTLIGHTIHNVEKVNFLRSLKHNNKLRKNNYDETLELKRMREINYSMINKGIEGKIAKANPEGFSEYRVFRNFETRPISV